ncbi:MAG: hypothetical protein SFX73_19480 [Kofleriaceae bacterium]|nr:hypothetical protein [Kofleriaceae bacterium]
MLPLFRRSLPVASWVLALGVVLVLAAAILLPGLGSSGLWEPQERQLADRVAPPKEVVAKEKDKPAEEPPAEPACMRTQPKDATARTLSASGAVFGRDNVSDSDAGRRLPFALMGLVTVLAAAGIAMRFAGARAGLVTAIILLSMPLLLFQSRMLTTEIGTACGATLLVYGFVALARIGLRSQSNVAIAAVDIAIAVAALVAGRFLGFRGGGMLLGLIVPIGAYAAAGGLGMPTFAALARGERAMPNLPALIATLVTIALVAILAYQIYELRDLANLVDPNDPSPPGRGNVRAVFGHAVLAEGCWSSALGGIWNANDDIRMVFDSTFEQIAYGTFPWGVLAPIAMLGLVRDDDRDLRAAGAVTLAWAGTAWIASEVFQRKVGFTVYAGFPALAIAIGVWLDSVLARRVRRGNTGDGGALSSAEGDAMPLGMRLVALFFLLAVLTFGLDMRAFPDRLTSLLVGNEQLAYPKTSTLLFTSTKNWPVLLGMLTALPFALSLLAWRDRAQLWSRRLHELCAWAFAVAMGMTIALAAFWQFAWLPRLSENLSSKVLFDTYRELRKTGDILLGMRWEKLVIMGDLGHAPHFYADATPETVQSRDQIVKALAQKEPRVFAIAPQTELCTLHREMGGNRYYVLDDRNVRNLLLSNKLDGTTDKNPLADSIVHEPPTTMAQKPKGRVVWDNKIELLGWTIPNRMYRGQKVKVTLYYKILAPVGGTWKSLMHFDGPLRFNGDHPPINDRCPTSTWQPGDYIVDTHVLTAGGGAAPSARYDLLIGFFTGSNPNFRNMPLSEAPPDMRDETNRVKIMSIALE